MFARILANTAETEAQANPELTKAKQTIKELRSELQAAEGHLANAKVRAMPTTLIYHVTSGHRQYLCALVTPQTLW